MLELFTVSRTVVGTDENWFMAYSSTVAKLCRYILHKAFYNPLHSAFSYCKEEHDKENLILSINYDVAAKKRKKDFLNNNTKIPCEYRHCFFCEIRTAVTAKS